MLKEKIICANAANHIFISKSVFQLGFKRVSILILAPGSVKEYNTIIAIIINKEGIKIFETKPIPLSTGLREIIHNINHNTPTAIEVGNNKKLTLAKLELPPTKFVK